MTEDHNCSWTSGSIIHIDDEWRIQAQCDICCKELIEDFNVNKKHFKTGNHKKLMEEYNIQLLLLPYKISVWLFTGLRW